MRALEAILAGGRDWFTDRFWGLAATGLAMDMAPLDDTNNDDSKSCFGIAMSVGSGYEVLGLGRFAIDIQTRYLDGTCEVEGMRIHRSVIDILLGFNGYEHGEAPGPAS